MMIRVMEMLFGDGRNLVRDTAGLFRINAEDEAARQVAIQKAALTQFEAEFSDLRKGGFDRVIDGLNRLPRPGLALGTLALFIGAMVAPDWFAARMQGIALVPEPLWWLLGVIVSFYFGARHQAKGQEFQAQVLRDMVKRPPIPPEEDNAALNDWRDQGVYGGR